MKKSLFIIGAIIIAILANITIVKASSTPTVSLKTSSSQVKPGDTFTVTISVTCEDGINGIDTTYSYDENKLEYVSGSVANTNNWSSLSSDNQITVICNSTSKITSADVYVLTFKVKDSATIGDIAKINTTDILVDSDASSNSESTISAKTASVTIAKTTEESGNNGSGTEGDNSGTEGDNTDNSGTGAAGGSSTNGGSTGTTSQPGTSTSSKGSSTVQDNTKTSNSKLPKTGMGIVPTIIIAQILLIAISYITYRGLKKYRDVK